jgi:succinoglycan biosynthesis transport protein ExoP
MRPGSSISDRTFDGMREPSPYLIRRVSAVSSELDESDYRLLPDDEPARIDLRQYWRTIREHLWLVVAVPLALVSIVAVKDLMATPLYTAQATILIKNKAPQVFDYATLDSSSGGPAASTSAWDINSKTEYRLLNARSLAVKVIATEALTAAPAFTGVHGKSKLQKASDLNHPEIAGDSLDQSVPNWLVDRYLTDLKVIPAEETELVDINFTSPNPDLSARIVNAHIREFIHQGIELNTQASDAAARFLEKKLAELKRQVERSELALNDYRREKGIIPGLISVNGNQDVVLERVNKLSDEVQQAHLENINLGTKIELINQGHAEALPAVIESKLVQSLKENLDGLLAQYAATSSQFKPDYPPMAQLLAKIKRDRAAIGQETDDVVAGVRSQYAASLRNEEALSDELKHQKDFALGLNDAAVKYMILQREADTNRELYNAVLKRMKDVEVEADLHASNISVVDPATVPLSPSSPRKVRDLLATALLGLMAGLGLTFLLEHHDDSFKSAEDIESYLMVPQLGMIPDFGRSNSIAYGPKPMCPPELVEPSSDRRGGALVPYGFRSPSGEAYRMLRTALLLSRAGGPPKTTLITSAAPSEGKTTISVNLAVALAGSGKRVLLIDADLRRPNCHDLLGTENHFGLTEVLSGLGEFDDLIRPTGFSNLFLLSSGEIPPNPSELLGSDKMREVLSLLGERYDHLLVDSPPVTAVTDAVVLSTLVDGVVLVANKRTPRQQVKAALSGLRYARAKMFGVVLNMVGPSVFSYNTSYYGYEYGPKEKAPEAAAGK